MEKFTKETDLLDWEESRVTRKELLPKWFYILLAVATLYFMYGTITSGMLLFRQFRLLSATGESDVAIFGVIPIGLILLMKVLLVAACIGVLMEKQKAVGHAITLLYIELIMEVLSIGAQIFTYYRYTILNAFVISGIFWIAELTLYIVMIRQLKKVRAPWPLAEPSRGVS